MKNTHTEADVELVSACGKRVAVSVWVVRAEIANK